jgi:hypothetical protein
LVRGCDGRSIRSRCLLEGMHKRPRPRTTSCRRRRELRGSTGRAIVVSSSRRMIEGHIVRRAGPGPIVVYPQTILLSSRTIQVQRILLALRQLPQYRLEVRSWLPRLVLTLIAGHCCYLSHKARAVDQGRAATRQPPPSRSRRNSYTAHSCAADGPQEYFQRAAIMPIQ